MVLTLIFYLLSMFLIQVALNHELCISEFFKPVCLQNEMIFFDQVYYGRKLGKCIKEVEIDKDFLKKLGYLNCFKDVKQLIGPVCAGKQSCEVFASRINIETNCKRAFVLYLKVTSECIKN